jgi:hypothetical protein
LYYAVSVNESARELMQNDNWRELAVKRLLRKYGYPPDMQMLATETVLKQAEMIAEELMR